MGTTTFRPPYTPVTYGAIAGRDLGDMFDPVRKTALHEWHEEAGALFENVGQRKRAWYYPRPGESREKAGDSFGPEFLSGDSLMSDYGFGSGSGLFGGFFEPGAGADACAAVVFL